MNTLFKIEDPINLNHAELHKPRELNLEVSICKLPREPFSMYGGQETMHLLMTTYCQDIMTNFGCVHGYPFFRAVFQISEIYTSKQAYFSTNVFILTISLHYGSKVRLNFRWLWYKSNVCIRFIRHVLISYKSIVLPPIHENLHASSKTAPRYKFGPYMKAKNQFICYWWHIVAISSRHHE